MEEINDDQVKAIQAALEKRRKDEAIEHALGREMRRIGLVYDDYIFVIQLLRAATPKNGDPWEVAKKILKDHQRKGEHD